MVRVAPDFIAEFALAQDRAEADAIFIPCGALRTLEVIGEIETRAGKPAICSNQAMIWDCLRPSAASRIVSRAMGACCPSFSRLTDPGVVRSNGQPKTDVVLRG